MAWRKRVELLIVILVLCTAPMFGQMERSGDAEEQAPATKIEKADWEKSIENLDYGKTKTPKKEKDEIQPDINYSTSFSGSVGIKNIVLGIVIAVLAIIIILVIIQFMKTRDIAVEELTRVREILKDEDIEHFEQDELSIYLTRAIASSDFRLAVRIQYLMIIRQMADAGWITVKREKTNFDYLRELKNRNEHQAFKDVTLSYEFIWYGDVSVSQNEYSVMTQSFDSLLKSIPNE
jgi:hypothetical protein